MFANLNPFRITANRSRMIAMKRVEWFQGQVVEQDLDSCETALSGEIPVEYELEMLARFIDASYEVSSRKLRPISLHGAINLLPQYERPFRAELIDEWDAIGVVRNEKRPLALACNMIEIPDRCARCA